MADLKNIFLFRMVHINNVPHILENGITHSASSKANRNYISIGDVSIISTREGLVVPNSGKNLADFIPFYFGPRMPMLYVLQGGFNDVPIREPRDIVYCVTSVADIIDCGIEFYFTDGHAVNRLSGYYTIDDVANIEQIVDMRAVEAKYWNKDDDLDLKRRKEAEFLVSEDIPPGAIRGWVVYSDEAKDEMAKFGIDANKITVKPNYYF